VVERKAGFVPFLLFDDSDDDVRYRGGVNVHRYTIRLPFESLESWPGLGDDAK